MAASDDFSSVIVTLDKPGGYVKGETITLTATGQSKHTADGTVTHETVTVTATITAASGATTALESQPFDVVTTTPGGVTNEDVTLSATDSSGRTYTPKAGSNGRVVTAVA
jgi:hypothetical protein